MRAVIGTPREAEKIALPLSGPKRRHARKMQLRGSRRVDRRLSLVAPNLIAARAVIEPPSPLAWVGVDQPTIKRPRQNAGEHDRGVVSLTTR